MPSAALAPYYSDSSVTIYLGNCLEIAPLLEASVVVSDPPYGMNWDTNSHRYSGGNSPTISRSFRGGGRPRRLGPCSRGRRTIRSATLARL